MHEDAPDHADRRPPQGIGPADESAPVGDSGGGRAVADERAAADGADTAAANGDGETLTRLVLVLLGIAILGLATWWLSPGDAGPLADGPGAAPASAVEETPRAPALLISVFGGIDDRYFHEPCSRIAGGGLVAFRATVDLARQELIGNHLGVSMGDLSLVPGRVGQGVQTMLISSVLPETGIDVMAAGKGELQHGSAWVRTVLAPTTCSAILCANALDADGERVLRGWQVTSSGGHTVLTVAVLAESVGYELLALGSDLRVGPPAEFAARALAEGSARAQDVGSPAMTTLLLVQGTVDEAAAIVRDVPGFDVVVAARGPVIPELHPRTVEGTPIIYPGRGARFVWHMLTGGSFENVELLLARIGDRVSTRGSPYENALLGVGGTLMEFGFPSMSAKDERAPDPRGDYVGATLCADCHPDEAVQHAGSPHVNVPQLLADSRLAGSPACLPCHVTAPFRLGGWLPDADPADLAGISCERCHGPASAHEADPGPGYGAVDFGDCYACHLPDRTPGFDARASWAASGHGAPPAPPVPPPETPDDAAPGEDR